MNLIEAASSSEASKMPTSVVTRPRVAYKTTGRKSRSKTLYGFAHPAPHARHTRLRLRPKLLLQLQQVSQTSRPLPVVDVLPSMSYLPLLARKFPAMFRAQNGLGPYDLIVVISEKYGRTEASILDKDASLEDEDKDHRQVVAIISQKLQEKAWLKGKAEICLDFGPVWEASPLPGGAYEFVTRMGNGVQVMRWVLRGEKNRRMTARTETPSRDNSRHFTFSVIDPTTRQHPVLASMNRNLLEVHNEYSVAARSSTGPMNATSDMSAVSDTSDKELPLLGASLVRVHDELRTLIVITGIWVAFREGWSDNFSYDDPMSTSNTKSILSHLSSKYDSPTTAMNENGSSMDKDKASPLKESVNGGKRCMSVSSVRRSNTISPVDDKQFGSPSKCPKPTDSTFTDLVRRILARD